MWIVTFHHLRSSRTQISDTVQYSRTLRGKSSRPRILPPLILVPSLRLPLLRPRPAPISVVPVPVFAGVAGTRSPAAAGRSAHGVDLAVSHALDGSDVVLDELHRGANAPALLVVPDGLDPEALALEFASVHAVHRGLRKK